MARKVLVGMLLLGALFIFGLATFYVENWQFYLGKGYRLRAEFPIAQTLDKGDTVRLAGVPVGTVENLEVRTEVDTLYPVEAVLWIRSGVTIRADDTAMIKMSTLFGGNYVAIERGDPGAALLTNNEYISKTSVAPSITQVIEQSTETLSKISGAFEEISRITKDLTEGKGTLARLLKEEDFYNELQSTVAEARDAATGLKASAQRLEQGEGVLGKLLMDDEMAQDFETLTADAGELASNLRAVSADLQNGRGTLGRLMQDEELYEKLSDSVGTIGDAAKTLREGEGILPRLLQDKELADDLEALTANAGEVAENLRDVSARIRDGEGALGKLLTTEEAYKKLDASLDDLNAVTSALREGEGTLGKLMRDEKLYEQISQIADDLQAMLDTYREQSPVLTFAGAVFGAF